MKYTNFLKNYAALALIASFFDLLFLGTGYGVKSMIMESVLGHHNIMNAIGAFGTVLFSTGCIALSLAMFIPIMDTIKSEKYVSMASSALLFVAMALFCYSCIATSFGFLYISDAYSCNMYGLETFFQSMSMAFSFWHPLLISGILAFGLSFGLKIDRSCSVC